MNDNPIAWIVVIAVSVALAPILLPALGILILIGVLPVALVLAYAGALVLIEDAKSRLRTKWRRLRKLKLTK